MTTIEWTDETWNPTRGCSMAPGSELGGCLNCYAARNQLRRPYQTAASGKPFAILRDSGPRWSGEVELVESKLTDPLHWKQPRRVFVNSMSDLFHEELPIEAIVKVFTVMESAYWHTFQVLTKRAGRMQEILSHPHFPGWVRKFGYDWLGPKHYNERGPHWRNNVWLGVSVEDQANKHRAVRFLSIEPLLEDIGELDLTGIHWIIVGGESGPGARPFDIEWARSIIRQCKAAGVPVFVKQLGAKPFQSKPDHFSTRLPYHRFQGRKLG